FEDQYRPEEPGTRSGDLYELPAAAADSAETPAPALSALPTRSPRGQAPAPASTTEEDSAAPALPARRLPRSAARHAPTDTEAAPVHGNGEAPAIDTAAAELPRPAPKAESSETGAA